MTNKETRYFLDDEGLRRYHTAAVAPLKEELNSTVKTVNGVTPDEDGNVNTPVDFAKKVNGKTPDSSGNITIDTDSSLSISGEPADGAATGTAISTLASNTNYAMDALSARITTANNIARAAVKRINGFEPDANGNVTLQFSSAPVTGDLTFYSPSKCYQYVVDGVPLYLTVAFSANGVDRTVCVTNFSYSEDLRQVNGEGLVEISNHRYKVFVIGSLDEDFWFIGMDPVVTVDQNLDANSVMPPANFAVKNAIDASNSRIKAVEDRLDAGYVKSINGLLPDQDGEIVIDSTWKQVATLTLNTAVKSITFDFTDSYEEVYLYSSIPPISPTFPTTWTDGNGERLAYWNSSVLNVGSNKYIFTHITKLGTQTYATVTHGSDPMNISAVINSFNNGTLTSFNKLQCTGSGNFPAGSVFNVYAR